MAHKISYRHYNHNVSQKPATFNESTTAPWLGVPPPTMLDLTPNPVTNLRKAPSRQCSIIVPPLPTLSANSARHPISYFYM
jgi:hypothetical protein